MDRLSNILKHFAINSELFFAGNLCGEQHFGTEIRSQQSSKEMVEGDIHLLRSGQLDVVMEGHNLVVLSQPSVVFVPASKSHKLTANLETETELVCAKIHYGGGVQNPIVQALPELIIFPLSENAAINQTAEWLFKEAFEDHCGRSPMIENLFNVFMILVLRRMLENSDLDHGMLAGLAHPKLSRVLVAIHEDPADAWNLVNMAELAMMSRSRFAQEFHQVVGQTPKDYVVFWRISLAQQLLKQGHAVTFVAHKVGYENGSVLARVFRSKLGISPKQWLKDNS